MKKIVFYLIPIVCTMLFSSCEESDSSPGALLNLILVDSPAKWDSVFVEIKGVDIEILREGREAQREVIFFEYKSGDKRIKVSELVAGNALLLGRKELPVGQVINATVILGEDHTMFLNEKKHILKLSDPSKGTISLPLDLEIEQGLSYDLILDMNLEKSIHQVSESPLNYTLDPFFSLQKAAEAIELSGSLYPTALYPAISISNGIDTLTTHTNTSGKFLLRVPTGNYTLYLDPKDERYQDTTFVLDMLPGQDSVLLPITFKKKP